MVPGQNQSQATLVGSEHSHHYTITAPQRLHWCYKLSSPLSNHLLSTLEFIVYMWRERQQCLDCVSILFKLLSCSVSFRYVRSQVQHACFLLEKWKKPPRNAEISSRQLRAFYLIINLKSLVRILRYLWLSLFPLLEKLLLNSQGCHSLEPKKFPDFSLTFHWPQNNFHWPCIRRSME